MEKLVTVTQVNHKPVQIPMRINLSQDEDLYEKIIETLNSKGWGIPIYNLSYIPGTHPQTQIKS